MPVPPVQPSPTRSPTSPWIRWIATLPPDDLSESVTVGNSTDLVITKIVDNGTPDEGDTVTFTVTVTNSGPAQATNVSIDDVLPAGLTIGSVTPSIGSYTAPTWTIGTLNNGVSATSDHRS